MSLLAAVALSLAASSETPYYQRAEDLTFGKADAIVLSSNLALGCAIGTISAMVRKESIPQRCLEGLAAGSLVYAGQKAASLATFPAAGWYATLFMGMGSSMQENILAGRRVFDGGSIYLGPLELAVGRPYTLRILPGPLIAIGMNVAQENHLNYQASLWSGTLVFEAEGAQPLVQGFTSYTHFNVVTMRRDLPLESQQNMVYALVVNQDRQAQTLRHEMVHAVSYRGLGITDTLFRESSLYSTVTDTLHLNPAADIVFETVYLGTSTLPRDMQPLEFHATTLTKEDLPAFTY